MAEINKSYWLKPSLAWLLIFVQIAIARRFIPALENPTWLFIVSCIAIIPLAGWMGKATEHLAEHLGQDVGRLLNETFGNAAEHSSAILMAMRNKMDLSLGIALQSSLQTPCLSRRHCYLLPTFWESR